MKNISWYLKGLKNPGKGFRVFFYLQLLKYGKIFNDKTYIKLIYYCMMGKRLNLNNPQTFNEKIQWLKLYDRKPIYTDMVDKILAKDYVARIIGNEHIIPTLAVFDNPDQIDFDKLPNQFVLKCNHGCGDMCICSDKTKLDYEKVRESLREGMNHDYYMQWREWPYKNVKRRIICEKFMVDESGYELKDYKFFCFNGKPEYLFIASDRQVKGEETKFDFFDMDFNHMPFTNGHPNNPKGVKKPAGFEKMKELAAKLSAGIPHVRVDFYDINGQIYFGELTLSHWSGMVPFEPEEWDKKFGDLLILPPKTNE